MADMLGKKKDAVAWRRRAREQLATLLEKCVRHDRFCTLTKGTMPQKDSASLLNYIPVLLGRRLPRNILRTLVKDLSEEGRFLTRFGLATQAVNSKAYSSNGYWRGPIWAPSTYLIFDGLIDAGEVTFAAVIARRFCDLCVAQPAMWENFDALTGKGLCCPAYTWTAAVFMLLAQWLAKNDT
jgi:glycogen debranching enzyme